MQKLMRLTIIFLLLIPLSGLTQINFGKNKASSAFDNSQPREYEIGGIKITGAKTFDHNTLIILSGLTVGKKITLPGDDISKAIQNLWDQKLFSNVKIMASKIEGDEVFLNIILEERPRLSKFRFRGIKKGEADDLREKIKLIRGKVLTEHILISTENKVKKYFEKNAYLNAEVTITQEKDSMLKNNLILTIEVDKGEKVKIKDINVFGNEAITDGKIRRTMKDTKQKRIYNIFKSAKFIESNFKKDKYRIIDKYNELGYRDAKIVSDSVYHISEDRVNIDITIDEGNRYYFREINWAGNKKYSDKKLNSILGIEKGDVYNQQLLDARLFMNPEGNDVSSLYLDDGYLFFSVTPVEVLVENDSIDFEIRVYEGKQARINEITITGNTKTNDHVILREIRTKPGQLFKRSDIIRSQRELNQLGFFDPEKMNVLPKPNQEDGTVDIEYIVEEKPSDQIELSGGWGGGRLVGTLGIVFNNFSTRNFFDKDAWRPLPAGDGQRLSVRAQSTGLHYQSYNLSFTEPWLGGKKPNSFSVTGYHSVQTNGQRKFLQDSLSSDGDKVLNPNRQSLKITGVSVGLGRRLKWPDDYFLLYNELSYQYYDLNNYQTSFIFSDGFANNLSLKTKLSRNSIDQPIYPRSGSKQEFTVEFTPPYSSFRGGDVNYSDMPANKKYNLVEYHKWKFNTSWFTSLAGKLVLNTKAGVGFLGFYDEDLGLAPFERFYLGGDGLSGFLLDGREIIRHRGYPEPVPSYPGAAVAAKYTLELRYPLSLNPSATIYGLAFAEAGNAWLESKNFSPFEVKRAAGVGIRIFMPMFGLLGLDYGYRFDEIPGRTDPNNRTELHFTIGQTFGSW